MQQVRNISKQSLLYHRKTRRARCTPPFLAPARACKYLIWLLIKYCVDEDDVFVFLKASSLLAKFLQPSSLLLGIGSWLCEFNLTLVAGLCCFCRSLYPFHIFPHCNKQRCLSYQHEGLTFEMLCQCLQGYHNPHNQWNVLKWRLYAPTTSKGDKQARLWTSMVSKTSWVFYYHDDCFALQLQIKFKICYVKKRLLLPAPDAMQERIKKLQW